jgi:outer membrane autotransporter protein
MLTGSTLKTTINNDVADDAGRVVAAGLATIAAGTTIDITVTGTLTIGQTYIIVSGGSSTMVVPTTITDNSASYNFTASIGGSSLTLTVIAASVAGNYTATTTTSNATAAATTLEAISDAGATGDMATVITAIDGLTGTARGDAIATMISDPSGALIATSLSVQSLSLGVVTSRMAALRSGLSGTSESGVSSGNAYSNSALWGQAFGTTATQDRRKDSDGYDADTAGLAFGGDTLLEDGEWTVGGAYSFAVSNVNNKGSRTGNGSDIKSHQGTLYASLDGDAYYVDVLGSIARNSYETNRQISIGSINRTARGDFNAMQYSAKVGGGYNFPMGDGLTLTPTASLQATRLMLDGYTETGADSLNLAVKSQSYNHVQSGLGVKVSYMVVDYGKERLSASVHATWLYDVKSVRQATTSTFTGGGGSFVTEGPAPARNAANLGASLIFDLGTGLSIAATYDVEIKDQYLGHSATATGRWEF